MLHVEGTGVYSDFTSPFKLKSFEKLASPFIFFPHYVWENHNLHSIINFLAVLEKFGWNVFWKKKKWTQFSITLKIIQKLSYNYAHM